ncbi:MAG: DEAD/DEAH box helicase, partial [Christensenellales bacterium]
QNGYLYPTEIQQKTIPLILNGKDIVGRSQTGSGKTFAFGLPIIQNIDVLSQNLQALVVCPTRELTMQVADELKKIAVAVDVKVCAVFGGSNIDRQIKAIKNNPHILVGTPGRLIDLLKRKKLNLASLKTLVLDEADEMLDMGFRPDIEKIISHTNKQRQTILFSATIPQEIKDIVKNYQKNSVLIELGAENKAIEKIEQSYVFVEQKNKKELIKELFNTDVFGKTILFVNTKRYAEDLESFLNKNNITSRTIHGDLKQNERKRVLQAFKDEKFDVLIATDVAARGLDIKQVEWVVNYDLPQQLEYYVHRIGRTARAGQTGKVLDIITNLSQLSYLKEIEKQTKAKIQKYQTKNENINHILVDTKKLAKSNSRFGTKSKRQQYAEEKCNRKSLRFGGASYDDYFEKVSQTSNTKTKSKQKQTNKNGRQKSINNEQKKISTKQKSKSSFASHNKNFKDKKILNQKISRKINNNN